MADDVERIASVGEPAARARSATDALAVHQHAVTRLARIRRAAIAELRAQGLSYAEVGQALGVTRGRVAQLGVSDYGPERKFFGGELLTITTPLRAGADGGRPVIAQEDFEASTQLARLAERMDLETTFEQVAPNGDLDLGPQALVLICGPKSSPTARQLIDSDPIFSFGPDEQRRWQLVERATGEHLVSGIDEKPSRNQDFGYFARLVRPDGRPLLLIAGIHAVGSLGVINYIAQRDNLTSLYNAVGLDPFSMIVSCTFEGTPARITSSEAATPPRGH